MSSTPEYQRQYRRQHPEKMGEYQRRYRATHPGRSGALYFHRHPEKRVVKQRLYRTRYPDKKAAHDAVSVEMRAGRMSMLPCAVCGVPQTEAHHPDYSKPLDVVWLCPVHHLAEHAKADVAALEARGWQGKAVETITDGRPAARTGAHLNAATRQVASPAPSALEVTP